MRNSIFFVIAMALTVILLTKYALPNKAMAVITIIVCNTHKSGVFPMSRPQIKKKTTQHDCHEKRSIPKKRLRSSTVNV